MTAVNWLIKIYLQTNKIDSFDIEQAKEMEKQMIIDANYDGQRLHSKSCTKQMLQDNAESYFDETYGSKGSDESVKNFWVDDVKYQELIRPASSQIEISDEEIEKASAKLYTTPHGSWGFVQGAKWYREQLKKKQ